MATDRRDLVAGLSAAAALAACGKKEGAGGGPGGAGSGPLHGFLVEAGGVGTPNYVLGLLACRNPAAQLAALKDIRVRTGFRTEFSAGSTNRYKLLYATPAFRLLAETADLKAYGLAVAFPEWARRNRAQRMAGHEAAYRALVGVLPLAERPTAVVHMDRRTSAQAGDARLLAAVQQALGAGGRAALDGAQFEDLMQLAATLFGTIRYAATGGRSKVKLKTAEALKGALGVGGLDAAALGRTGKVTLATTRA